MRHTQKALQTDTAVLLEKLLHMFASFGRSALLKPRRERLQADIGRRLVYHSRRIALSSPNSSCAQENSAYGTSLFIRIYSVAFLTSAPAQMLFPLLPCIPQSYTGTSGCRRTRETSRKAYCRVLPHPYAARVALRLTGFPPCTRCSPPNFIGSHTRISSISAFASCKRYSLPAIRRASSAIAATPSTACVCVWSSRCV